MSTHVREVYTIKVYYMLAVLILASKLVFIFVIYDYSYTCSRPEHTMQLRVNLC